MSLRWTQSLTEEVDSTCVWVESPTTDSQTVYRIEVPSLRSHPGEVSVGIPGAARVVTPLQQRDAATGIAETIVVPEKSTVERVTVSWGDGHGVLYLPSKSFLDTCNAAIDGDWSAAKAVLRAFQTPVQVPLLCGAFLNLDDLIALVETVTKVDRHAASTIHSYRYPILRGALVSPAGLSVTSAAEFETLVDGFDAIESIGSVSLIDSVADTMLTTHGSLAETDELIASLGYELADFEERDDGRFFACYLAHAVVTGGIPAARGHAMQRRDLDVHYERGKTEARNAPRHERGEKWRRLICAAARESTGEFVYVLSNALYWTGYGTHSDSRIQELLYAGASAAVDLINLPELAGWAHFERHVAAGHRLRSRNQFAGAAGRFVEARQVARRHDVVPEWEAHYNEVVVRAHDQQVAGDHEAALGTVDAGIEALLQYDLRPEAATRVVHHLRGHSCETAAELVQSSDPQEARSLLAEARDHYEVIDFTRSRDRTERKRTHIDPPSEETGQETTTAGTPYESESTSSGTSGDATPSDSEPSTVSSAAGTATEEPVSQVDAVPDSDAGGGSSTPSTPRKEPTSFAEPDDYPDLNDSLTPHDETKVGSGDIMMGPDAQSDESDPFVADDGSGEGWY